MTVKSNRQRLKLLFAVGDYVHYDVIHRGIIFGICPTRTTTDGYNQKKRLTHVTFAVLNVDAQEIKEILEAHEEKE